MYALISSMSPRQLVGQVPALAISIVTAELFFKFHSFTLECIAFLATWYVVDAVGRIASDLRNRRGGSVRPATR